MKRSHALILSLLFICASFLSGCGRRSSPPGGEPDAGQDVGQAAEEGESDLQEAREYQKWTGDLDEMDRRRAIRVLVAFNRIQYFYDMGKPRGIIYEAMSEFEKFLNRKLHPRDKSGKAKIHVVFVPSNHRIMPRLLAEGYGDLAVANITIDPEREKIYDFSVPTADTVRQVIVTGPAAPSLSSLEDLAGKEVYVKASSTHFRNLRELSAALERRGKPPIKLIAADEYLEDEDILEMVHAGLVDMTLMDDHVAGLWAKIFDGLKVRNDLAVKSGNRKGWMFRKNSPRLKAVVDEFIVSHRKGTVFGNILINRYLRSTRYALNATSAKEMEKFNRNASLFRKYADQYDFDWMLIAATAYQESQMDQSKRSPVGAVGIMQVMPKTAAGPPVMIRGIEKVENNVHAGVKLLKFIRDEYFDEPDLDPLDKTFLTLASYNAGPTRISQCRRKAAEMGLDPNVWFHNVEYAVAKVVGPETVQYAANIYKYYLGYKIAVMREEERKAARKEASRDPAVP